MPLSPFGSQQPDRRALGQRLMSQMVPQLLAFRQQQSARPPGMGMPGAGMARPSQPTVPPGALAGGGNRLPGQASPTVMPPPAGASGLSAGLGGSPSPAAPARPMSQPPRPTMPQQNPGPLPGGPVASPVNAMQADQGIGGPSIIDFIRYLAGQGSGGRDPAGAASAAAGNAGGSGGMGGFA